MKSLRELKEQVCKSAVPAMIGIHHDSGKYDIVKGKLDYHNAVENRIKITHYFDGQDLYDYEDLKLKLKNKNEEECFNGKVLQRL